MKPKIDSEPLADWYPLTRQFKLTLKVSGRSPRTTEAYDLAIRALLSYLLKMGLRIGPADVTAEHLRMFFASLMDHCAPATINQRYRSLNRFFGWLVTEGRALGLTESIDFRDDRGDVQGDVQADRFAKDRRYTEVRLRVRVNPAREPATDEEQPAPTEEAEERAPPRRTPAGASSTPWCRKSSRTIAASSPIPGR